MCRLTRGAVALAALTALELFPTASQSGTAPGPCCDARSFVGPAATSTESAPAAATPADSPLAVPEPDGLWTGPQRGYTPATLEGATVIDGKRLAAMMPDKPVLLDVVLADRKPANFPADRPWLPTHRSIPGAVWMPGAGVAPLSPEREALFFRRVEELTGGDKTKAIVTFCRPECWGSWNAGRRLVLRGYRHVHWFPEGVESWQDDHDTAVVKPDPAWAALPPIEPER